MKIEKKVWPAFFEKIVTGEKKIELRLGDFECKPEDILVLREWDPDIKEYTGRTIEKQVGYVLKTRDVSFWSKEEIDKHGFQVIQFK